MGAMSMEIEEVVKMITVESGADYFGVADLSPARDAILKQGGPEIAAYPRAISIGIALQNTVVDMLPRHKDRDVIVSYRRFAYEIINIRLDTIASRIASVIQKDGFKALPVPAAMRFDDERLCAVFSNKMAAHLAGLGWIGKSCLLVTPDTGPRVRWVSVLTAAPLEATGAQMDENCGECRKCVDICPSKAFTGQPFRPDEEREVRYDAHKCKNYFEDLKAETGAAESVCGLCLYVCPFGRALK
jgi:epoxyqueuosine reductase